MRPHPATLREALSVALTVGAYGLAFGAAGVSAGFSVLQTCLFSLVAFTGASQFAAVGVVAAGGGPVAAVLAAGALGTRNALYGLQLKPRLGTRGATTLLAAHLTIDESTAVALAQGARGEAAERHGFWVTGAGVYVFWNLFTLAGALGAHALGDPAAFGLDAAVPAAFLGLLWPRLVSARLVVVAVAAMAFALAVTPVLPAGLEIVATVLVAVAFGWAP
ncbi:MAG TPA: AzlC family ABC transporter permease [Acidimicrobiales bacterium]|nr:AzlC family ABC transporter permease [Acidimicrobiales bacterium]